MSEIILENVTKVIKRNTVINDVSLKIKSGKITGFKGVNGSGKTMLMRLISGLIIPTNGNIIINDKILHKDITFPESIGTLIENPAFLDSYSGFRNLKLLASIKGNINDDKIGETISLVGLDPSDKKKYRKYSLGMKQRLGIASAIMEDPDIVILDEPTNALDDKGVEMVKQVVKEQKQRGAIVIVSCHDLNLLKEMSDVIYLMNDGKVAPYTGGVEQ